MPLALHSPLLEQHLDALRRATLTNPVLDLACGGGRNGLFLARNGIKVLFADRDPASLAVIDQIIDEESLDASTWLVDLEKGDEPLAGKTFGAVIVFRYLHRPLFVSIKQAIQTGGMIVYETFNVEQREFGRPKRAEFLLEKGELPKYFLDWQLLHTFDGIVQQPLSAISQLVAKNTTVSA
jgi:SAM-dependent methyltransferase